MPETSKDPSALDVTVAATFEATGLSREAWDAFVLESGSGLYMTYDWCRIWWKHYGTKRQLKIFVVRRQGRLIGLVPMFIDKVWLGPVALRIAKRVGSDFALTIFALPVLEEFAAEVYSAVTQSLVGGARCDAVWFGVMPGNDRTIAGLRGAAASLSASVTIASDRAEGVHTAFEVPPRFDDYLASLDKQQRHNYKRRSKMLAADHQIESSLVRAPAEAAQSFAEFKAAHEAQWKADGRLGHFGDWPQSADFNAELVAQMAELDRYRMMKITADGNICGAQYYYVFGDHCYARLPSRATGKEWDRYGLGVLVHIRLVETMIGEGQRHLELGAGHYDYKVKLGGQELETRSILVVRNSGTSALRARLFLKLSEFLHFAYYRVWFLKLSPRFPMLQAPLWRMWIRSRI